MRVILYYCFVFDNSDKGYRMRRADFERNKPGRLVKVKRGVYAFYPDPLPPAVEPDWRTAAALGEAERALGELRGVARLVPERLASFRGLLDRAEALVSSRMDGSGATLHDLLIYEQTGAGSREAAGAARLLAALRRGAALCREMPPNLSLAQDIHETMAGAASPGAFRAGLRRGADGHGPVEGYIPPPEGQTRVALFALDRFLKRPPDLPAAVRAAFVFYQFNAIHPFHSGSGPIGRALPGLMLYSEGFLPLPSIFLSRGLRQRGEELSRHFLGVVHSARWDEWIRFFLDVLAGGARQAASLVAELLALHESYHRRLAAGRASQVLPQLVDELFINPAATTAGAAEFLRITFRAAQLNIDKLVEMGILEEATGRKRGRVYIAREIARHGEAFGGAPA
ncbi:MAG: Fic family protein [Candidatus Nitrospinota bacterium M3_3B_026]